MTIHLPSETSREVLIRAQTEGLELWVGGDRVRYRCPHQPSQELLELLSQKKTELIPLLEARGVPPLPSELTSLIRASSSGLLARAAFLPSGMVPDLGRYVCAWCAAYLVGGSSGASEAIARLQEARRTWFA